VSGSGAANLEALPGREDFPAGADGEAEWAEALLLFEEANFEGAGTEVRSMDQRDRKVGLFGDFLERVGHGKFVEWRANEEQGGLYKDLSRVHVSRNPIGILVVVVDASLPREVVSARTGHPARGGGTGES